MTKLPRRFAPLVYGIIQSGITSAIASGIATWQAIGFAPVAWAIAWLIAWAAMLPVVVLVSPMIQKAVLSLTEPAY